MRGAVPQEAANHNTHGPITPTAASSWQSTIARPLVQLCVCLDLEVNTEYL